MFAIRLTEPTGTVYVHLDEYDTVRHTKDLHSAYIDTRERILEVVAQMSEGIIDAAPYISIDLVGVKVEITSVEAVPSFNYPGKFVLQDTDSEKFYDGSYTDIWFCEIEPSAITPYGATKFDSTEQATAAIAEMMKVARTDENWFDPANYVVVAL